MRPRLQRPRARASTASPHEPDADGGGSVLVGYGSAGHVQSRRRVTAQRPVRASVGVVAKPPIRKLARDLNVDLVDVVPSGAAGEVTREDVMKRASQASVFRNIETPEWGEIREETIPVAIPDAAASVPAASAASSTGSREESIPVRGVRKATANAMTSSAYTAPHVSVWVDVDASRTMELVKRLKTSTDFADVKVSPLLIMARAVIWAVRRTPMVNAAWVDTEDGAQIRVRHYVNLGIAAATPRGLLVPNIKDAQDLNTRELARALEKLTLTAREGKTTPADQQGGTITITNIGVFGVDAGTPIINPGEVGHRRPRRDQAEAVGRRRRGAPPLGHHGVGLVRPPGRRRRRGLALHRRRRLRARGARAAAGLTLRLADRYSPWRARAERGGGRHCE